MGLIVHGAASILRREHGTYVGIEFNIPAVLRGILRLSYSGQGYLCRPHVEKAFHVVFSALLARQDLALVLVDALLQAPMSWLRAFTERFLEHSSTLSHPTYGIDMYALDWAARLDNLTAAVLTRLSGSETGAYVSNIDALKICYFASSTARFLFIVQPPRKKWLSLFNILLDRIDSPTEGNKTLLDNEKAAMADSMLGMMYLADANSLAWTLTADGDDKVYKEWVTSRRRDDGIFPDRLFECIAPYSQKMREPGHWGVRRALEAVQMKTEEAVRHSFLSSCDMISKYTNLPARAAPGSRTYLRSHVRKRRFVPGRKQRSRPATIGPCQSDVGQHRSIAFSLKLRYGIYNVLMLNLRSWRLRLGGVA
ncbi:hypothetical protein BC629DRAFT_1548334 [Irpex lacteus]|nr:hypothetical protein BC629DRAFT_1548334 [Irpex lacteus]